MGEGAAPPRGEARLAGGSPRGQPKPGREHDSHTRLGQVQRRGPRVVRAGRKQRHVAGITTQEERLAGRTIKRPDDADAAAGGLEGIADRAVAQEPVRDRRSPLRKWRMRIDDAAGEHDGGDMMRAALPDRFKPYSCRRNAVTSAATRATASSFSWADMRSISSVPDRPWTKPGTL